MQCFKQTKKIKTFQYHQKEKSRNTVFSFFFHSKQFLGGANMQWMTCNLKSGIKYRNCLLIAFLRSWLRIHSRQCLMKIQFLIKSSNNNNTNFFCQWIVSFVCCAVHKWSSLYTFLLFKEPKQCASKAGLPSKTFNLKSDTDRFQYLFECILFFLHFLTYNTNTVQQTHPWERKKFQFTLWVDSDRFASHSLIAGTE